MPAESVSHPGDVQDVKFPTHVHFTKSNSRGLSNSREQLTMEHVGFYITAAYCDKNGWAKDAIAYEMSEVLIGI